MPPVRLPAAPPGAPRVALYSDRGVNVASVVAAHHMFGWMGAAVERVDAQFINDHGLKGFHLLCVPGGNMYTYSRSITTEGKENIHRFVREGGGYLGICGGAYYAASKVVWWGVRLPMEPLALYNGTARGPLFSLGAFGRSMCRLRSVETNHPAAMAMDTAPWMLYAIGPALVPDDPATVTEIARYEKADLPAILAFEYGRGRVLLTGTHPEIEEDSDRDGTDYSQKLEDNGSDWDFMKSAVDWCLGGRRQPP